jgi:S-DNA-T family DNA segregation ATPase FtsK/SpoIIIE
MPMGAEAFKGLYRDGISGTSGGLICGSIAMLFFWLVRGFLSYLIFILAAVFCLLGAMQITITSIIRAIQDRPRPDWEEEPKERQEPASVVVNHIANKRIEHLEHKREKRLQREAEEEAAARAAESSEKKKTSSIDVEVEEDTDPEKVSDMIRQIDGDIEKPVSVADKYTPSVQEEKVDIDSEEHPSKMPPLNRNDTLGQADETSVTRVKVEKVSSKESKAAAKAVTKEIERNSKETQPAYVYPPIHLLHPSSGSTSDGTMEMRENSRRLNETLASFKIEAHIINVTRGPSVTRYEVELEKGVRLNKLTTAADDIALSLGATGVRIAAVPGKISVVGIEVPNRAVTTVSLRDVIDSQEFVNAKSKSSFAVGKDIGGNSIVGNIAKLPHMLIAGTTGSGKSVCMNSIIISLLYKASPDDVKLIMVDPKMVELGIYNGIPHLLIPVVTDPKKAAGSLQWAVAEMMRRYKAMSDAGVRDIESYNSMIESQQMEGKKLPQVVVIIDELADLMLVAAKEVEESICRIAQMGRASGIHLVIATQRPSADVITGLMKANIPSRIAFAVASAMEYRIILDTQGAEKLVGKGDMLYAPIGNGKPKRVQGCFVSDPEVEAVTSFVKANYVTSYDKEVMDEIERKASQTGTKSAASDPEPNADELDGDEMLPAAVDVILEIGQASVSMLQRRLKLGYARAARIVDEMEEKGIVGPYQGSKPRDILVTKEQWAQMRAGSNNQMSFEDVEEFSNSEDDSESEDF